MTAQESSRGDDGALRSGIFIPPGEKLLGAALREVLAAQPMVRAVLFAHLAREIEQTVAATVPDHPWTCVEYTGTDGSRIFRGGVGHSLVIDTEGRLWRARSYEDFATTYTLGDGTCTIATLTPVYAQMRQYLPR